MTDIQPYAAMQDWVYSVQCPHAQVCTVPCTPYLVVYGQGQGQGQG